MEFKKFAIMSGFRRSGHKFLIFENKLPYGILQYKGFMIYDNVSNKQVQSVNIYFIC